MVRVICEHALKLCAGIFQPALRQGSHAEVVACLQVTGPAWLAKGVKAVRGVKASAGESEGSEGSEKSGGNEGESEGESEGGVKESEGE